MAAGLLLASTGASAILLAPTGFSNRIGTVSTQPLSALAVQDESGTDNTWSKYIQYTPASGSGYVGVFSFSLGNIDPATVQSLAVKVNFLGQNANIEKWAFELYDNVLGRWIPVADNSSVISWQWSPIASPVISSPKSYINSYGVVRLRYRAPYGMDASRLDYLALDVGSTTATSTTTGTTTTTTATWWRPKPGTSWQIQYAGTLNTTLPVTVYNIDLFDTPKATIDSLHASGKRVVCYFSAGSWENWRPDASQFPSSVLGNNLSGWPGERWLDVRQLSVLMPIMNARMDLAKQKGCDAVDPDNVDGYTNSTGFPLQYYDQINYVKALASSAHGRSLAVSLKNDLDQVRDLVPYVDFAVNEQCFEYSECDLVAPFIAAGKPVFNIEYNLSTSSFCPQANSMNFDSLKKNLSLDAARTSCR